MAWMPPRHGKSELCSLYLPIWFLENWPHKRVVLASYEADFAASWGRRVRNAILENQSTLDLRISEDSSAANRWETTRGGGMVTTGIGGPLTGRGADLLIVDDPVKNAEEGYSETVQKRTWEWWTSTAYTRLEPQASALVIQTRWHDLDLSGRILAARTEPWDVISLPALAEPGDPLGREEDAPLWPSRYGTEDFARIRGSVGPYVWAALYQQRPAPAEGGFFKRDWFTTYAVEGDGIYRLPDGQRLTLKALTRFATVDLAASTKASADYTVIATFGKAPNGKVLLLDVDRERREGPDIVPAIERAVRKWGTGTVWIEKVGFQLALVQAARRAGIPVRELEADRDKIARALPLTAEMEGGRLLFPRATAWMETVQAEMLAFPAGAHDDIVDALAYGAGVAARVSTGSVSPLIDAHLPPRPSRLPGYAPNSPFG